MHLPAYQHFFCPELWRDKARQSSLCIAHAGDLLNAVPMPNVCCVGVRFQEVHSGFQVRPWHAFFL